MNARQLFLQAYLMTRSVALLPLRVLPRRRRPREWRRILLVRIDRIGDLVLSTPFLRNLREAFPAAHLVLLGTGAAPELLSDGKLVDRIIVYGKTGNRGRMLDELRHEEFDLAVDMHYDYTLATAILTSRVRAGFCVGFDMGGRGPFFDIAVPTRQKKHFVEESLDILRMLGLTPRAVPPEIALHPRALDEAHAMLTQVGVRGRYATIHPGGFYPQQRWPAERFARLADLVAESRLTPVLIGARGDAALLGEISGRMARTGAIVCGQSIGVAAAVIGGSALFVGNNSGPLHIACAMNVPSVSTMGPTDPVRFWPMSERARVLRADTLDHISVEEMFAAMKNMLP